MGHCLLLDTTIQGVSLGIASLDRAELLSWENVSEHQKTSDALTTLLSNQLTNLNLKMTDLNAVCVSVGPGSFTGIKVGLAFVYGLLQGNAALTVLPVSSLQLLSEKEFREDEELMGVLLPASRTRGAIAIRDKETKLQDFDAANIEQLAEIKGKRLSMVKPWSMLMSMADAGEFVLGVVDLGDAHCSIMNEMARVAQMSWQAGSFGRNLPEPMYLRRSTAEEKLYPS